ASPRGCRHRPHHAHIHQPQGNSLPQSPHHGSLASQHAQGPTHLHYRRRHHHRFHERGPHIGQVPGGTRVRHPIPPPATARDPTHNPARCQIRRSPQTNRHQYRRHHQIHRRT